MGVGIAAVVLGLAATAAHPQWPTLREELRKHGLDAARMEDADRQITSYAVSNGDSWFGIAYYWHSGELLPPELRVRTLDRATNEWRHAVLDNDALRGGSAVRISRAPGVIYLDLHINPSAGALVVLSDKLTVMNRLNGWSSLLLPDGKVVYENSMVHFGPFHAGSVSLYDPVTNRSTALYPRSSSQDRRKAPLNRSIHRVEQNGSNRVRISVHEQPLTWGTSTTTAPVGPEVAYTVTCVLSTRPTCTVGPKQRVATDRQVFR